MSQVSIIDIEGNNPQIPTQFNANTGFAIPIGNILEIYGDVAAAGSTPVFTVGSGNNITTYVQVSQAIASSNASNIGLAAFNSAHFFVDANGFVSLMGGDEAIDSFTTDISGPVLPDVLGNVAFTGATNIFSDGSVANTMRLNLQGTLGGLFVGRGENIASTSLSNGTLGQYLQSQGAGADPAWTTLPSFVETITGDSGSISGANLTIYANNAANNSGQSVSFVNSLTTSTMNLTDSVNNTMLGKGAGNLGQSYNSAVALGYNAGNSLETGSGSVFIGFEAGLNSISGRNVYIGENAGQAATTSSANTAIGTSALQNLLTGTANVAIGNAAGSNYSSSESDNIVIAHNGTAGESGVIRIGNQSNQTTCFIAGINGVTASNPVLTTINSSTGQMGVQALTQYALVSGGASNAVNLIATTATAGQVLQSQGAAAQPAYSTATYPSTVSVNNLLYASSANVVAGLSAVARSLLTTNSSGVPTWRALTDGQFVIGSSSSQPIAANITAGTGITIANGSNSITVSATGGGFAWTDVTGATQTLAVQNGYITNRGGGVTYTLPSTASLGDTMIIIGKSGLATITPNANQQILVGSASGTVGVTGTIIATDAGDCITLVCITAGASTVWRTSSFVGNWTIN